MPPAPRILALALACAALLAAAPAASADGGKHLLRYGFKPGETFVVATDVLTETTSSGNRSSNGMRTRDRLRAVAAGGERITLEREGLSVEDRTGEELSPNDIHLLAKGQKVRLEASADGRNRKVLASPIKGYEDHLLMRLPERPVAVGESWPENGEIDIPFVGKMELRGDWTLTQVKTVNGRRLAYLLYKGAMRDTRRGSSARDEVRFVFDVDAGIPQKIKAVHDISFTAADKYKVETKVTVECALERETAAPAAPKPEEW